MDLLTQQIKTCTPDNKLVINLDGPEGNVFYLMKVARRLAMRLGLNYTHISADMEESDYAHALKVFQKNFGEYVELESEFEYNLDEVE